MDKSNDYIFRFKLDEVPEEVVYDNPIAEMVRSTLSALLDVVVLTEKGKRLKADGFRFINEPENNYSIWPVPDPTPGQLSADGSQGVDVQR